MPACSATCDPACLRSAKIILPKAILKIAACCLNILPVLHATDVTVISCMIWHPSSSSVLQTLAALEETGLLSALEDPETPLTVFVPNNAVSLCFVVLLTGVQGVHELSDHVAIMCNHVSGSNDLNCSTCHCSLLASQRPCAHSAACCCCAQLLC